MLGVGDETFFPCPLPGHDSMASFDTFADLGWVLFCDCFGAQLQWDSAGTAEHWYPLSDVYFAVMTATVLEVGFTTKYRGAYRLLLNVELGLIDPAPVELPRAQLSDLAQRTADLYRRLYGAQVAEGFPNPGALAVGLVREWCGCSQGDASDAIKELQSAGVIVFNGKLGRTHLYRPGEG
jgi:hypothetical protein